MLREANIDTSSYQNSFFTIETHTVGEPTRIVISGFPKAEGSTMMERKEYYEKNFDFYRQALMAEPRGHHDMVGAVLMEPINPEADLGVIYMDTNRWINMCGHATIGCATAAVEAGLVPVQEPYTRLVLDTPAGLVHTLVKVENKKALEVSLDNVPSFLFADNIAVELDGKTIPVSVSFGGSFFALVDAVEAGLEVSPEKVSELTQFGMKLLKKLNGQIRVSHPELNIRDVANVEIFAPPKNEGSSQCNIVISAEGQVDRSPCGTGTSAKLAALYAKRKLKKGELFVNENFTGARFRGEIKEEAMVGDFKAIIPTITGSAYISGVSTHLIDQDDPLKYGFIIG